MGDQSLTEHIEANSKDVLLVVFVVIDHVVVPKVLKGEGGDEEIRQEGVRQVDLLQKIVNFVPDHFCHVCYLVNWLVFNATILEQSLGLELELIKLWHR